MQYHLQFNNMFLISWKRTKTKSILYIFVFVPFGCLLVTYYVGSWLCTEKRLERKIFKYYHGSFLFFFKKYYLLLDREREHTRAQTRAVSGRGRGKLPTKQGAWYKTQSQDGGIMTRADGRRFTNRATQLPHSMLGGRISSLLKS